VAWPVWLAALWWGSLSTVGFGVVPLLFATLPTPALAGNMAARLFEVQTWVSAALGLGLLLASRSMRSLAEPARRSPGCDGFILAGVVLALLLQFGVAPRIVARENLRLWHTLGSGAVSGAVVLRRGRVLADGAPRPGRLNPERAS
jgi:hypothetical protein